MSTSLTHVSDDAFRRMVDEDLRVKDMSQRSKTLRLPENVDRWYSTLLAMIKSVEGQLAARRTDWDVLRSMLASEIVQARAARDGVGEGDLRAQLQSERERYLKWRAGTLRFKTGLDEHLAEARHLRDQTLGSRYERAVTDERAYLATRVRALEDAIRQHRDLLLEENLDDDAHEDADENLWSFVSNT